MSNGPLARKELADAVKATGYVFTTKNPLNSIGSVLYDKTGPVKSKGGKFHLVGGAAAVATSTSNGDVQAPAKKKKGKRSAATRARMAAAQKASWAKRKNAAK